MERSSTRHTRYSIHVQLAIREDSDLVHGQLVDLRSVCMSRRKSFRSKDATVERTIEHSDLVHGQLVNLRSV